MKKNNIEKIRLKLVSEKEQLQGKSYRIDDLDLEGDETDLIQARIIANVSSQLSSRDKEKILQIETALKKIEAKHFGFCEECNEAIAEKRLEANPYSKTCISCAEAKELEKRRGFIS